jgi:hypothetical protein
MECVSIPDPAPPVARTVRLDPSPPLDPAALDPAPLDPPTQPIAVVPPVTAGGLAKSPWSFVDVFAGLGVVLLLSLLLAAPLQFAGSLVAENLLQDTVLHTFRAEDLDKARGWAPGEIHVTPRGVRITLVPPSAAMPSSVLAVR